MPVSQSTAWSPRGSEQGRGQTLAAAPLLPHLLPLGKALEVSGLWRLGPRGTGCTFQEQRVWHRPLGGARHPRQPPSWLAQAPCPKHVFLGRDSRVCTQEDAAAGAQ